MGVHDLWPILEPVRESVPLYSLNGKTLAVDVSLWVCEAQHVQGMMGRVTKPYLRNLFFRVSSLTLMGVKLVFVMEGEAPKLKEETMRKRTETRYRGFKTSAAPKCTTNTSRGRFKAILRECAEMLDYMGLPWVTAAGEAEAMCAYLDSQGLVDGCITNDGDAFLYGARTVYRNFNMNTKDPQIDCYRTNRVQTELHLSRESLVGLGILLGCDYIPKGIPGIGKEQALRLIQTLQGQTLLQRFIQWKEDDAFILDGVPKKVPHCNVCQHPGSAKAHERGGCLLCDSKQFCQPQDFDYQCPCDWHHYQQSRQALSFEANIRKKTLASPLFPFTEIIREFLISKDKPVLHFKRKQPNLLLMQKFAHDKMEWPAHYTSEKVLVLLTYTNLMNRKHRRDVSSQMKPLRILKPRVRNGVACFEVVWRTPEHYVFPEDQAAENHVEVRTVEEESLFCVAYPEVVESYWREKALAEENKTKKKKTKSKKEKTADVSDGISDLLAQMTVHSSSSARSEMQSQTRPLIMSKTTEPEVVVLDTPVNHKWQQKENDGDDQLMMSCPRTVLSHAESDAAASLSVSAVIDALHLSDVDWDSSSFTSSPAQITTNQSQSKTPVAEVKETEKENIKQTTSNEVKAADSRSESDQHYTECSLMDRVMMRNAAKATNQMNVNGDVVSKQLSYDITQGISSEKLNSEPHEQVFAQGRNAESKLLRMKDTVGRNESISNIGLCVKNYAKPETCSSKQQLKSGVQALGTIKNTCGSSKKPPQKYTFVKVGIASSVLLPQRYHSDPGQSANNGNMKQTTKKSVCRSVCSSSDDSDVENQQSGLQRKTKAKDKSRYLSDVSLKPKTVEAKLADKVNLLAPKSLKSSVDDGAHNITTTIEGESRDMSSATGSDVFVQDPASPVSILDSDDSVICLDSPLPLAERLRLKFMN